MDKDLKTVLQQLHSFLKSDVANVQGLIDGLYSANVFNSSIKQRIDSKPTDLDKMEELLTILPKRKNEAIDHLCVVLLELNEDAVLERLLSELRRIGRVPSEVKPSAREHSGPSGDHLDRAVADELPADWPSHDVMRLEVVPVADKHMEDLFQSAKNGKKNIYPMWRKVRGRCLLLNNHDFSKVKGQHLQNRDGTETDQLALDQMFKELGFKVIIRMDCSAEEMMSAIQKEASEDHSQYNCFICVILTHGERDILYGVDGRKISLEKFMAAIDGENCKSLVGKPKLFFIQACQGDQTDYGATPTPDAGSEKINYQMKSLGLNEQKDSSSKIGIKSDFYLAMATVPGYVSWKVKPSDGEFSGSWFMQAVVYVISSLGHRHELNTLMTRVKQLVSQAETSHGFKQVSVETTTLVRDFYFFPGLSADSS